MKQTIKAADLHRRLVDKTAEMALLDVREVVPFGAGHALWATQLSVDRLELDARRLIPRLHTEIVVMSDCVVRSRTAKERLESLGFEQVKVLEGGLDAWRAAGGYVHREIEVPSKGFGGFVERVASLPFIDALTLRAEIERGTELIIIDSRPKVEYERGNIPSSIDAPGGQMLRCFDDIVASKNALVVVNCMSRTRGILGALSLIEAGVPNRVVNLRDGTRGWQLAGFELEVGARRYAQEPSIATLAVARQRALDLLARAQIPVIDGNTLREWQSEPARTTYLFDLRGEAQYYAGHLPAAVNSPESKIVMNPGGYFATLNARIVLTDGDLVRASVAAIWLAQMGWGEVAVVETDVSHEGLEVGPSSERPGHAQTVVAGYGLEVEQVDAWLRVGDGRVIDVGDSASYAAAHIPGASWNTRTDLIAAYRESRLDSARVLLTSEDGRVAALAARDLRAHGAREVTFVEGGIAALRESTVRLTDLAPAFDSPRDDLFLTSSERPGDVEQNVRDYLAWETELSEVIESNLESRYHNLLW